MCCGSSQPLIKAVFHQLGVMGSQRMPMVEEWFATNQEQHTDMKPIAREREFDAFSLAVSFGRLRQDRAELIAEIFALLNPSGSGLPAARGSCFFYFCFLPLLQTPSFGMMILSEGCIWKEEFRRYAETHLVLTNTGWCCLAGFRNMRERSGSSTLGCSELCSHHSLFD